MSYRIFIPRCTHIKTNGTQCGSPALRGRRFCFFHKNWQGQRIQLNAKPLENLSFNLPVLEDADSIQVALMQIMRLILSGQLDSKTAGLLLYALQTAALNLRQLNIEPRKHESVIVDPKTAAYNELDQNLWHEDDFQEEEDEEQEEGAQKSQPKNDDEPTKNAQLTKNEKHKNPNSAPAQPVKPDPAPEPTIAVYQEPDSAEPFPDHRIKGVKYNRRALRELGLLPPKKPARKDSAQVNVDALRQQVREIATNALVRIGVDLPAPVRDPEGVKK